jgi:hypothetical protein
VARRDKGPIVAVKFLDAIPGYQAHDIAGFHPTVAASYIKRGLAEYSHTLLWDKEAGGYVIVKRKGDEPVEKEAPAPQNKQLDTGKDVTTKRPAKKKAK